MLIAIMISPKLSTFIPCIVISGAFLSMTRDEAIAILEMPREKAVEIILALADKAEKYDQMVGEVSPTPPSGMTPVYLKPGHRRRKKRPGRKTGHQGAARKTPDKARKFYYPLSVHR
jgi:hypothetical protein